MTILLQILSAMALVCFILLCFILTIVLLGHLPENLIEEGIAEIEWPEDDPSRASGSGRRRTTDDGRQTPDSYRDDHSPQFTVKRPPPKNTQTW